MINLLDINKSIVFDGPSHTYKNQEGKELISTSVLLSLYKNKFDEDGHIVRAVAKRDGLQVSDVLRKWEQTKNEGLTRGKSFHRQVEHFLKTGEILNEDYKDVVKQVKKFKFKGKIFCEIPIHSDRFMIGGTADLIELFEDNTCNLFDWKTNKEIDLKSKYGKKLLYPIDNYDECAINVYTFQLGIYQYMLEEHGFKVKKIVLFHVNPSTRKIDTYKIPIIKKDIKKLLDHYVKMRDW